MAKKKTKNKKDDSLYEFKGTAIFEDEFEVIGEHKDLLPDKAHSSDAGFDLYSNSRVIIPTNTQKIIPTGVKMNIPIGYRGIIKDRSGIGSTRTIGVKAGVIDAGYQGEIGIVMFNYGRAPETIEKGDKIAQLLIELNPIISLKSVKEFKEGTERGEKGFGSSGK